MISWHELGDDFFGGWDERYADYRASERALGIPPREICINEYSRIQGDLGVPGRLVQWIARFENSKVDACLAYWTDAGSLNNLVTRDNYNKATGAWWLYHWYAGLSGETLRVGPPDPRAEGLQGLAAYDSQRSQVRILCGGGRGPLEILVSGFDTAPGFGVTLHAAAWLARATGNAPASDPAVLFEKDLPIREGQMRIELPSLDENDACLVILTPGAGPHTAALPGRYPGEYAGLTTGWATPRDGPRRRRQPWVGAHFVVTAAENRFYQIRIQTRASLPTSSANHTLHMWINGAPFETLYLTGRQPEPETAVTVFLTAGINRIDFYEIVSGEIRAATDRFYRIDPGGRAGEELPRRSARESTGRQGGNRP